MTDKQSHWENVYENKPPEKRSWTQVKPILSIELIKKYTINKDASIIDIGGGDSKLVDYLLELGYSNITVLDISASAIEQAKQRLGAKSGKVQWIVCNILDFKPTIKYDIWHDRAAFHFLTSPQEIEEYVNLCNEYVRNQLIIATFSENGPDKCSGLTIQKYSEKALQKTLIHTWDLDYSTTEYHKTPFDTQQHFLYSCFSKK